MGVSLMIYACETWQHGASEPAEAIYFQFLGLDGESFVLGGTAPRAKVQTGSQASHLSDKKIQREEFLLRRA